MKRAMVVDVSRAVRIILSRMLAESGFDVVAAANGREALDLMGREVRGLHLVMVDWNMPELSGLEFVRAVRARAEFNAVRLLMATTETEIEQMARALESGADEYLMKPFTPEAVRDKLRILGLIP